MKRFIKGLFNFLFWVIISIALIVTVNNYIQRAQGIQQPTVFGWGFAVVETGSMEPNVPVGSLIVMQDVEEYNVGDVVTYIDYRNMSITHRIISIEDGIVLTRGDANDVSDLPFEEDAIVGKMQLSIPKLGSAVKKLKEPGIMVVLIGLLLLSFIFDIVSSSISKKKSKKENKTIAEGVVEAYNGDRVQSSVHSDFED